MSAYEQLMTKINATSAQRTEQVVDGEALVAKALMVLDQVTSEAYGRTAQFIGDKYEAAKLNIQATPQLFNSGRERARERTAEVLLNLLNK